MPSYGTNLTLYAEITQAKLNCFSVRVTVIPWCIGMSLLTPAENPWEIYSIMADFVNRGSTMPGVSQYNAPALSGSYVSRMIQFSLIFP